MNKAISYSGVTLASLGIIALFITAKNSTQLGVAIVLYPIFILFLFKYFILKHNNQDHPASLFTLSTVEEKKKQEVPNDPNRKSVEIVDIDKRAFLKLIGGVGLSYFIFSLFNRKVGNILLGEPVSGPQAPASPTQMAAGYKISEIISTEKFSFYGFIANDGKWLIMREDIVSGSFRYAKGNSNFSANWANREVLDYTYYHDIFQN